MDGRSDKPAMPSPYRAAARAFAQGAVEEQMKGFKSWAVMGDWEGHWKTMDKSFELRQLGVFKEMADRGLIYRKHKPVFWSPSSLTALAEAELEYNEDHVSTAALVKFPIVKNTSFKPLADIMPTLHAVIWTTTPWTLPANQAIAVHEDLTYTVVKSRKHGYLLLAESRVAFVEKMMGENFKVITSNIAGSSLVGSRYRSSTQSSKTIKSLGPFCTRTLFLRTQEQVLCIVLLATVWKIIKPCSH